jgi:hypothetical protein
VAGAILILVSTAWALSGLAMTGLRSSSATSGRPERGGQVGVSASDVIRRAQIQARPSIDRPCGLTGPDDRYRQ